MLQDDKLAALKKGHIYGNSKDFMLFEALKITILSIFNIKLVKFHKIGLFGCRKKKKKSKFEKISKINIFFLIAAN